MFNQCLWIIRQPGMFSSCFLADRFTVSGLGKVIGCLFSVYIYIYGWDR